MAQAKAAGAVTVKHGLFFNSAITFLIVAFAVFLLVRSINAMRRRQPAVEAAACHTMRRTWTYTTSFFRPELSERRDYYRFAERQTTDVELLLPDSPAFRFYKCAKMCRDKRLEGARYVMANGIEDFEALILGVANE